MRKIYIVSCEKQQGAVGLIWQSKPKPDFKSVIRSRAGSNPAGASAARLGDDRARMAALGRSPGGPF